VEAKMKARAGGLREFGVRPRARKSVRQSLAALKERFKGLRRPGELEQLEQRF
jgi:hypothetical protein